MASPQPQNNIRSTLFNDSLVRLRFTGQQFEGRSMPIYELGAALVSIQRIVNKAYLFEHQELETSAKLTAAIREQLALQIGSREKASDGYGLIPFLMNPIVLPVLQQVVATAITAVTGLAFYKILHHKSPPVVINQTLIVAVYPDVCRLADRVGGKGKAETVELIPASGVRAETVVIDRQTKNHLRDIEHGPVLGPITTIRGTVVRLYPRRLAVDIMFQGARVRVRLSRADFRTVRYQARDNTVVKFSGHPVYILGAKTVMYKEFRADLIQITKAKIVDKFEE